MIVLLLSLVAELYVIVKLATAVDSLQTSLDAVDADPNAVVPYESVEKSVASRFNDFYFGATDGCYGKTFHAMHHDKLLGTSCAYCDILYQLSRSQVRVLLELGGRALSRGHEL